MLPDVGFVKLDQIIGTDDRPGPLPVSKSQFYQWMNQGIAPRPVKLGRKCALWRVDEVRALLDRISSRGLA